MKFIQNNLTQSALRNIYKEKYMEETTDKNFFIHYKPTKCTFLIIILIFNFLVSSTRFVPEGSSLERLLYIQAWYSAFHMHQCKQSCG